jgi:hypothetical protein
MSLSIEALSINHFLIKSFTLSIFSLMFLIENSFSPYK